MYLYFREGLRVNKKIQKLVVIQYFIWNFINVQANCQKLHESCSLWNPRERATSPILFLLNYICKFPKFSLKYVLEKFKVKINFNHISLSSCLLMKKLLFSRYQSTQLSIYISYVCWSKLIFEYEFDFEFFIPYKFHHNKFTWTSLSPFLVHWHFLTSHFPLKSSKD